MKTNYLSYYTYYKYKVNNVLSNSPDYTSCFSDIYRSLKDINNGEIKIFINKDPKLNSNGIDNYCLLTMDEVSEYINWLNIVTGINLFISTDADDVLTRSRNSDSYFFVNILLNNNTKFEVKFILALIRDMYEYSFNIQIKTAFLMKSVEELSLLDLSERICLSKNCIPMLNNNHSTYIDPIKLTTTSKFIYRYNEIKDSTGYIQNFYHKNGETSTNLRLENISDNVESGKLTEDIISNLIKKYNEFK